MPQKYPFLKIGNSGNLEEKRGKFIKFIIAKTCKADEFIDALALELSSFLNEARNML